MMASANADLAPKVAIRTFRAAKTKHAPQPSLIASLALSRSVTSGQKMRHRLRFCVTSSNICLLSASRRVCFASARLSQARSVRNLGQQRGPINLGERAQAGKPVYVEFPELLRIP